MKVKETRKTLDQMTAEDWIIVRLLVLTTQAHLRLRKGWDPEVIRCVTYMLRKYKSTAVDEAIDAIHKEKEN